jgi:hypothetical protein
MATAVLNRNRAMRFMPWGVRGVGLFAVRLFCVAHSISHCLQNQLGCTRTDGQRHLLPCPSVRVLFKPQDKPDIDQVEHRAEKAKARRCARLHRARASYGSFHVRGVRQSSYWKFDPGVKTARHSGAGESVIANWSTLSNAPGNSISDGRISVQL